MRKALCFFCIVFVLATLLSSCTSTQQAGSNTAEPISGQQLQDENDPLYIYQWVLAELRGQMIPTSELGQETYVAFYENRFEGMGGCNHISGPIEVFADGGIVFGDIIATRMACPRIQQEIELLNALMEVDAYEIAYEELTLYRRNVPLAVFRAGRVK